MKINEIYHGFKLEAIKPVSDVSSVMYEFKHLKSGGKLVYLENEDTNKVFAAGFRTPPENSTGICHIIEHSLLCGSDKYPLKEPFVNLLKGSMATFLNAMTASDWTCYPVASQNDKDFDNLMKVYLDSVFAPLSIKDPKAFLQEGWHLELNNKDDIPQYKGVVYNEMKGAMSSVDRQLDEFLKSKLYEGTCYEFNSGGDPDVIPELTYEYYCDFYKKHYHPSNGLLYLYGKMDVIEKLKYIDEEYLSKYDEPNEKIVINKAKKHIDLDYTKEYEITSNDSLDNNTYTQIGFMLSDYKDADVLNAFSIMYSVLMENNDSPLKKLLMDLKLGDDVSADVNDDAVTPSIMFTLKKTNPENVDAFREGLFNAVKSIVKEGIDKKALLAAINNAEFQNKEMNTGTVSKGLFFLFSLLQSFNFNVPLETYLETSKYFNKFKAELNNGYFEGLLEKYILNSDHYVQATLIPSKGLAHDREEAMNKKMKEIKDSLSDKEIDDLVKQTLDLIAYQSSTDSLEQVSKLPSLTLSDIPSVMNDLPTVDLDINGIKVLKHEFSTNKIAYMKMYFDANVVSSLEVPYLNLLSNLLGKLDTKNFKAIELDTYTKTYLGDLGFSISNYSSDKDSYDLRFVVQTSSLDENTKYMSEVLNEVLNETIFDVEKVKPIIVQSKNQLKMVVSQNGMAVAMGEASKHSSCAGYINSLTNAYNMYLALCEMENLDDATLISKLEGLLHKIINKNNLMVSLSGSANTITNLENELNKIQLNDQKYEKALVVDKLVKPNNALVVPGGVSYNARGANLNDFGYQYSGKLLVLAHIVRLDYLWNNVRVKGGAYGCSIRVNLLGDITFGSYRDPNVENTYKTFDDTAKYLEEFNPDEREFISYLIGAVGGFDQPDSNNNRINSFDSYFLRGIKLADLEKVKNEMLSTTIQDLNEYSKLFAKFNEAASHYTVGNDTKIKEYNKFDDIKTL